MKKMLVLLAVVVAFSSWIPGFTQDDVDDSSWTFYYENDQFNSTDDHYTFGGRLSYNEQPNVEPDFLDKVPFYDLGGWESQVSYFLGLQFYTPRNIRPTFLQVDDRPFGAWLHVGTTLTRFGPKGRADDFTLRDQLELTVGIVGPGAGGENVQTFIHDAFGGADPGGWSHQLNNEPAVNVLYNRTLRKARHEWDSWATDLLVRYGGSAGNVFIFGNGGIEARVGWRLPENFGVGRLVAIAPGEEPEKKPDKHNFYLYVGIDGKAVARNIFLDGNTFEDSHEVDKEELVGELYFGIGTRICRSLDVTITQVIKSDEFELQDGTNKFISFNFTFRP